MGEEELNDHIVYSPEVLEFVRLSNAYCLLLEGLTEGSANDFIAKSLELLSGIYSLMMKLEQPTPVYEDGNEKFVTEQEWSALFQKIAQLLGPQNEYLRKADEDEFDRSDLVTHKISEDLSDIYQELRDFIELYSRGLEEIMNDALWEVQENFGEHWGVKVLNVLSALHQVYIKGVDPELMDGESGEMGEGPAKYDNSMFRKFQDQIGEED